MTQIAIRSAEPEPVAGYLNPVTTVASLWAKRDLIHQFTKREVLERHKGAMLGMAWNIISPMLTIAVYTFLFGVMFNVRFGDRTGSVADYVLPFFTGFLLYHVFSESANRAPNLITSRRNFVKKVVFPIQILPLTVVLSTAIYLAVTVGLVVVGNLITHGEVSATIWLFPAVLVPLYLLSLAASWLLASIGSFLWDLKNIVSFLTHLTFMVTPIFYPVERVPEGARWLLWLNPFTHIVEAGRDTLVRGVVPDLVGLGVLTVIALVLAQGSYAWFMKSRRGMADVV